MLSDCYAHPTGATTEDTAILIAAQIGDVETLAGTQISDELKEYVIRLAIVNNRHNVVQLLLESPYIRQFCNSNMRLIMTISVRHSSLDIVNSLVSVKCNIEDKNYIIYNAIESGRSIKFTDRLLDMKANISSRSYYNAPIVGACKNPNVDINIVYRLLAVKASLNIRSDDGYDSDNENYYLCTRIIENCNTNVLRALLTAKCNLIDGYDNGILGGVIEHALDLINNSDEILDYRIDGYYNRLYNTTSHEPITMPNNMIDLLLVTQYNAVNVHRSVRFIIGNLIGWKTDEVACRPVCPIMVHKPITPLDTRIITGITNRHAKYMEYRESPVWGNRSSHITSIQNRGYVIKIEQVLRRLIMCKVDITSTDNQLRSMDGMSLCKTLLFDTVKSAMDMRIRLFELEHMYITDQIDDTSPKKRMK
jgi:hypothetical protein